MLRALEVKRSTGRSILSYQVAAKVVRPFNVIHVGLELPRTLLYDRINTRVNQMISGGLLAEVSRLLPYKDLNALNTVGYKELFQHLSGEYSLDQAIELIKQNSRQYAKRQLTWFKKMPGITWCEPEVHNVMQVVKDALVNVPA